MRIEKSSGHIIVNESGEKLHGVLHPADSSDLVIVVHGFALSMDFEPIIDISRAFQNIGVNAFRFDWSGYGSSEGYAEDASFMKRASDLNSVISHFYERGYRIKSVVGHSAGGTAAIIRAAADRRIESVILIAPRLSPAHSIIVRAINESGKSLAGLIESPDTVYPFAVVLRGKNASTTHYFSKAFLKEFLDLDIYSFLRSVDSPVAILVGTEDRNVTEDEIQKASKINESISFVFINGAGHTFWRKDQRAQLMSEVLRFYKLHFDN